MKIDNRKVGILAENFACEDLKKKGYFILKRNFFNRFGEIDIIARKGETTVFVEVKGKTGENYGRPEEMINPRKLNKIRRMAQVYTQGVNISCRIDVVAVVLSPENTLLRLTHYENVY